MTTINNLTRAELDIYIGLLPLAYKLQLERTGLVCGADAEELRDKMFRAIAKDCI